MFVNLDSPHKGFEPRLCFIQPMQMSLTRLVYDELIQTKVKFLEPKLKVLAIASSLCTDNQSVVITQLIKKTSKCVNAITMRPIS